MRRHCADGDYHHNPGLLLDYLHLGGFLYYDARHLPDTVILDQRWVVEAMPSSLRCCSSSRERLLSGW